MDKIYERLLYGTNIDIENINNNIYVIESSGNMLTITQFEKGFFLFEADKNYIPIINEYIKKYKNNLFMSDAIEFFKLKFRVCDTDNPFKYVYGIYNINSLNTDCILLSTLKINVSTVREGITKKFDNYYSKNMNSDFIYFGTMINDEIVSLVNTEPNELNFKAVVLSCETLPEYRGKGYAKSNTAAITKYLLENGCEVITYNGTDNIGSIKTVESLGFQRYACQLAFFAL